MSIKNLIRMGHPLLRVEAKNLPLEEINSPFTQELIQDLKDSMKHYGGVGIAAPQIGIGFKVAILEVLNTNPRYQIKEDYPLTVFINPEVTVLDSTPQGFWEGCLSVPGLRGYVERPRKIQVNFWNEQGKKQNLMVEGFVATVFQHELDHLWGKLYVDHVKDTTLLSYNEEFEQFIRPRAEDQKDQKLDV